MTSLGMNKRLFIENFNRTNIFVENKSERHTCVFRWCAIDKMKHLNEGARETYIEQT